MEPIADTEIKRVLVVNAHPDDSDFGASGTIAQWVRKGIEVAYVFCTNGDQGGEESGFTKEEMPAFRCLLYTSPSPRDRQKSRMPSSA